MILQFISELLRPTDTFRRIRKIKQRNKELRRALLYADYGMDAVSIAVLKLDPATRNRFQRAHKHFLDNFKHCSKMYDIH